MRVCVATGRGKGRGAGSPTGVGKECCSCHQPTSASRTDCQQSLWLRPHRDAPPRRVPLLLHLETGFSLTAPPSPELRPPVGACPWSPAQRRFLARGMRRCAACAGAWSQGSLGRSWGRRGGAVARPAAPGSRCREGREPHFAGASAGELSVAPPSQVWARRLPQRTALRAPATAAL